MSVDRRPPPVHPSRRPIVLQGVAKLLGRDDADDQRLSLHAQMGLLLARTRREGQTYAGTVPHAEKLRRRAKNRRARASRRINRGQR